MSKAFTVILIVIRDLLNNSHRPEGSPQFLMVSGDLAVIFIVIKDLPKVLIVFKDLSKIVTISRIYRIITLSRISPKSSSSVCNVEHQ